MLTGTWPRSCLECHSHVTGDEGLGRRYTKAEVSAHKRKWEQTCAANPIEDETKTSPMTRFPFSMRRCCYAVRKKIPMISSWIRETN